MSAVSRVVKKTIRSPQGQMVGAVAKSKWTWASLVAGVFAAVGLPMVSNVGKVPQPINPPGVEQNASPEAPKTEAPTPPVPADPTKAPATETVPPAQPPPPVAEPPKPSTPPAATPQGPCFVKKARKVWQTYTYQQKYVGVDSGKVIYKPAQGKKLATVYDDVRVPCPPKAPDVVKAPCECPPAPVQPPSEPISRPPEPSPVNPTAPAPSVVQPGTVMYGVRGLGGIGDPAAFRDFATARGYVPVWIDPWDPSDAQEQLRDKIKKTTAPYALYGFSLGAKTVRDFAMANKDTPPSLVVTVGASSVVAMEGKFDPNTKVEHYFHVGTKHDVPGEFLKAPHTGPGNIQRVIADAAIAAKK